MGFEKVEKGLKTIVMWLSMLVGLIGGFTLIYGCYYNPKIVDAINNLTNTTIYNICPQTNECNNK